MAAGARAVPGRPTQPSVPQSFLTRPRTQPGGHERPCHARQPRPQAAGPAAGASVRRTRTGGRYPAVPHRRSPRVPNTAHAATGTGREGMARPPGMPGQTQLPGRASRTREPGRAASHRRRRVLRAPSPGRGGGGAACGLVAGTDGQPTCPAPPAARGWSAGSSGDGQTHVCLFRPCCQGGFQWSSLSESSPQA
ncbi:translation initiation factor IF-2-like [Homo sapiens]|uniref:translation initiation factor IF-2-like n=1 Tax=Homo sapiens TaxID=9606 RepID=UPI001FB19176|nr:translation initiation factor IF-2-like [Homo sapiens]